VTDINGVLFFIKSTILFDLLHELSHSLTHSTSGYNIYFGELVDSKKDSASNGNPHHSGYDTSEQPELHKNTLVFHKNIIFGK
jgi:hypothetical protein